MNFGWTKNFRKTAYAGAAALALAGAPASAQAASVEFDIEAQDLDDALTELALQANIEILFDSRELRGKRTRGIDGRYSTDQAIRLLLEKSRVPYRRNRNGTLLVGAAYVRQQNAKPASEDQSDRDDGEVNVSSQPDNVDEENEIIVTGTNIRGVAPESSPVQVYDREDIQNTGAATAVEFVQTLTQNFGGGAITTASFPLDGDINAPFNNAFAGGSIGSGVNLRGLGSGSTLVLLNGRRVAPSSAIGDFVDISMIPASALERVEVLTDGASSIYGADAVAGVINFILRDDFEGVETSGRYGTVTSGNLDEFRANVTLGTNWDQGNGIFVYEFFDRDNLSAADRSFSQNAQLPNDLLPSQNRHSVLASVKHAFSPSLEASVDASFSTRTTRQSVRTPFQGADTEADVDNFNLGVGLDWDLSDDWLLKFSGGYSTVTSTTESIATGMGNSVSRELDSEVWAGDLIASGSLFELPAGELGVAFGAHFRREDFSNLNLLTDTVDRVADRDVYALFGEANIPLVGPGQGIPGIHRLEVNISGRFEDYSDFGSTFDPKVGVVWSPVEPLRLRGSFNTSFKPPSLGRVGANDLAAAAAPTSFISLITGIPAPDPSIANVVLLDVSGTDPVLDPETSTAFTVGADFDQSWGKNTVSLSATYFDIEFENQLGTVPIPGNAFPLAAPFIAFSDPDAFPPGTVTFNPSQAEVTALLDSLTIINPIFGANPEDAAIISRVFLTTNLAQTNVSGLDFNASYNYDLAPGTLTLGVSGTYLIDFIRQGAATSPAIESLNTLFNPVDLNLRAQAGFSRGGLSTNLFLNYVDSYRVDNTPTAANIDSWTTFDLNIAYDTSEKTSSGLLKDTIFRLSVINLFNQRPPQTPSDPNRAVFEFDPINASPLQRFMSFEITKKW